MSSRKWRVWLTLLTLPGCVAVHNRLHAEVAEVHSPSHSVQLEEVVPNGIYSDSAQVIDATATRAGIFLLCRNPNALPQPGATFVLHLTTDGKFEKWYDLPGAVLPFVAAGDHGTISLLRPAQDDSRELLLLGPALPSASQRVDPESLRSVSRLLSYQGRMIALSATSASYVGAQSSPAASLPIRLPYAIVLPLTGDRLAVLHKASGKLSVVDLRDGRTLFTKDLRSPDIRIRASEDPPATLRAGTAITNAFYTAAVTAGGHILAGVAGHNVSQAVALDVDDAGNVRRTLRFAMPVWQDLRTPSNPTGYMQGMLLTTIGSKTIWIDEARGRLAFYSL